ncbi:MAG: DUF3107 domain-containing protein [Actinomycetes bacterium]
MEVKIGVQYAVRELVLESNQTPDEIEQALADALKSGGTLTLVDDHGRRVVVPSDRIAYVEIGEQVERRVGFGSI